MTAFVPVLAVAIPVCLLISYRKKRRLARLRRPIPIANGPPSSTPSFPVPSQNTGHYPMATNSTPAPYAEPSYKDSELQEAPPPPYEVAVQYD